MTYLVAVSLDSLRMSLGHQGVAQGEDPDFANRVIKELVESNRLRIIHTDAPELVERVADALTERGYEPSYFPLARLHDAQAITDAVLHA